ncbi:uncharacterized protein [Drosophila tropicalis]|uniref:uncharacterized protein n=1 Tax=Drosophila tropicalis TaxID=46794 RepID=UPI0035ABCCB2
MAGSKINIEPSERSRVHESMVGRTTGSYASIVEQQIEARAATYRLSLETLPPMIAILLTGRAESWWQTSGYPEMTWVDLKSEFLEFFLPPRYFEKLEDSIRARKQRHQEPYKEYLVDLRLMMKRAHYSTLQELDRIYENLLPDYKLYTRRNDFQTLPGLTKLMPSLVADDHTQPDAHINQLDPAETSAMPKDTSDSLHSNKLVCQAGSVLPPPTPDSVRKNLFRQPGGKKEPVSEVDARLASVEAETRDEDLKPEQSSSMEQETLEPKLQAVLDAEITKFDGLNGVTQIAQHVIVLKHDRPMKQRYYPRNPAQQQIINETVDALLKEDRIEPSKSPHSAPIVLRALDSVIGPEMEPHAFAYLDDIIVIGKTLEEHLSHLLEVFRRLREANLRINRDKCRFFKKRIQFLGHVVSEDGIHTDPEKVAAIRNLQPPTNVKELRRCLCIASWYRRFVPNFSDTVQPLTSLLKKGLSWFWNVEQQQAFDALKTRLTTAPVLACPDFAVKFCLQTDASDVGLGAMLTQSIDGTERVIAYASRRLLKAEENYSTTEKECLAIVWAIRKYRCYLEGYCFEVITDQMAKLDRKSHGACGQMGAGVATIRVRGTL